MSPLFYKVIHLIGIMMLFTGAAALVCQKYHDSLRKPGAIFHGIGLLLLLVSGFGMVPKLGYSMGSPWIIGKIVIWLVFGVSIVLAKKGIIFKGIPGWIVSILLGAIAAYLAFYKPGGVGA